MGDDRPVSVKAYFLSPKVLERFVRTELAGYLWKAWVSVWLLPPYSTDTCFVHLTNYIRIQRDVALYTGWYFSVFRKDLIRQIIKFFRWNWGELAWMHLRCFGHLGLLHICQDEVRYMVNANGVQFDSQDLTMIRGSSGFNAGTSFPWYFTNMEWAVSCLLLLRANECSAGLLIGLLRW